MEAEDALDVIEVATAVLVRNFELLHRRNAGNAGLDKSEYLLLRTLRAVGPADICSLAATLGLDPSTVGRQVAAMGAKGLVERAPDERDRRRSVVSATAEGREKVETARAERSRAAGELLDGWSEDDLRTLGEMFTRYNRSVAEHYLTPARHEAPVPAVEALLPREGVSAGRG